MGVFGRPHPHKGHSGPHPGAKGKAHPHKGHPGVHHASPKHPVGHAGASHKGTTPTTHATPSGVTRAMGRAVGVGVPRR